MSVLIDSGAAMPSVGDPPAGDPLVLIGLYAIARSSWTSSGDTRRSVIPRLARLVGVPPLKEVLILLARVKSLFKSSSKKRPLVPAVRMCCLLFVFAPARAVRIRLAEVFSCFKRIS